LKLVYQLIRTGGGHKYRFSCYQDVRDADASAAAATLEDPYITPERVQETQGRSKFLLSFAHTESPSEQ
jgi:hypothetical protein